MTVYELAVVVETALTDAEREAFKGQIESVITENNGEVLVFDDWGARTFAQATRSGDKKGHYLFFIYKADSAANVELERRFKINESVMKHLFVNLGVVEKQAELVKAYKSPYSSAEATRPGQGDGKSDIDKDRRLFARRRTCWFKANKTEPSWKDPSTFSWLINEFGKISPARVTGLSSKYQRLATTAIKRARCIGLVSYVNNRVAE